MCGSRSPSRGQRLDRPAEQRRGPRRRRTRTSASNSTCIPRQIPSTGSPARGALDDDLVEAELARARASPRRTRPTPGTIDPVGAEDRRRVAGDHGAAADALDGLLDRAAVAHPVVDDGDRRARQRPLGARDAGLLGVDRRRLAQRAGERLEQRLDHVVGVRARLALEVERDLRVGGRRRGRTPRPARGRSCRSRRPGSRPPRPGTGGRRRRSRRRPGPRPSGRRRGRSGGSRARSPSAVSSACPRQMPASSTVWWAPVSRSPSARSSRSRWPWRASRSSMWSKNPTPVTRAPAPVPPRASSRSIFVSAVWRWMPARRFMRRPFSRPWKQRGP